MFHARTLPPALKRRTAGSLHTNLVPMAVPYGTGGPGERQTALVQHFRMAGGERGPVGSRELYVPPCTRETRAVS